MKIDRSLKIRLLNAMLAGCLNLIDFPEFHIIDQLDFSKLTTDELKQLYALYEKAFKTD